MAPESPTKTQDIRATTDEVTVLRAAGVEVVAVVTDRGDRATQSGTSPPDTITILRSLGPITTKTWKADGAIEGRGNAKQYRVEEREVRSLADLSKILTEIERDPQALVIRGKLRNDWQERMKASGEAFRAGCVFRRSEMFDDVPHHWVMLDGDGYVPSAGVDPISPAAISEFVEKELPSGFHGAGYHWQLSSSAGRADSAGVLKVHTWFWRETPATSEQLKAWAAANEVRIDAAVFHTVQEHFTAAPVFERGVVDPVAVRGGFLEGGAAHLDLSRIHVPREERPLVQIAPTPPELSRVRSALFAIPNDAERGPKRDGWRNLMFAVHAAAGGNEEGLDLFDEWTRQHPSYTTREVIATQWHAARADKPGGITVNTLFSLAALEHGWEDPARREGLEVGDPRADAPPESSVGAATEVVSRTEDMLALWVENSHRHEIRYIHDRGVWMKFDGYRWVEDRTAWVPDMIRHRVRAANYKHDIRIGKAAVVSGVERLVKNSRGIATSSEHWDTDPMLLGTPIGPLDMRTGEIGAADPRILISKSTRVAPAEPGTLPVKWMKFLDQATGGDEELQKWLQKLFGYSLTGHTTEQLLVFIHGGGGNGKGVLVDTVRSIFGDYGHAADIKLFTAQKHEGHATDRAALVGTRLVTSSETEKGHSWAMSRLKSLTGGDPIRANFMRQDTFEFEPQFQLVIMGSRPRELTPVKAASHTEFLTGPIVIDVFTHSADYYASPVLYPFTDRGFDGVAWINPWFMALNYLALLAAAVVTWLASRQRSKQGGPAASADHLTKNRT